MRRYMHIVLDNANMRKSMPLTHRSPGQRPKRTAGRTRWSAIQIASPCLPETANVTRAAQASDLYMGSTSPNLPDAPVTVLFRVMSVFFGSEVWLWVGSEGTEIKMPKNGGGSFPSPLGMATRPGSFDSPAYEWPPLRLSAACFASAASLSGLPKMRRQPQSIGADDVLVRRASVASFGHHALRWTEGPNPAPFSATRNASLDRGHLEGEKMGEKPLSPGRRPVPPRPRGPRPSPYAPGCPQQRSGPQVPGRQGLPAPARGRALWRTE